MSDDLNFKLEIGKNKELLSIRTFNKLAVSVDVESVPYDVGVQEAYTVVNVVPEDKIPHLMAFLKEEKTKYENMLKSWTDVKDSFEKEIPDVEALKTEFDRLIVLSNTMMQHAATNVKKLRGDLHGLNRFCDKYNKYVSALPNIKVIAPNIEKIDYQIDFITKNYQIE